MAQPVGAANVESRGYFRKLWLPAIVCTGLLLLELFSLFYGLEGDVAGSRLSKGVPLASVQAVRNDVRQKPAGTLIWGSSPEGHVFHAQDSVVTLPDSEVTVMFNDHSEVVIEPESMVIFEGAPAPEAGFLGRIPSKQEPIRARVIRGSLIRRKSGAAPLEIRLGAVPAPGTSEQEPIVFEGVAADAIYRVVRRAHGVEVIVQSGTVNVRRGSAPAKALSAGKTGVIDESGDESGSSGMRILDSQERLPPPRLKKPVIEIAPSASNGPRPKTDACFAALQGMLALLIPSADAAEARARITVHFAWEAITEAKAYRVQLSKDSEFRKLESEHDSDEPAYHFRTTTPDKTEVFFFRVAGISRSGFLGEFSTAERIEIHPVKVPQPPAKAETKPEIPETIGAPQALIPSVQKSKPAPSVSAPELAAAEVPEVQSAPVPPSEPWRFAGRFSLHSTWQWRRLSGDLMPARASGSGLIPLRVQVEGSLGRPGSVNWNAGFSFLPSTLHPETTLVSGTPAAAVWRAWIAGGFPSSRGFFSIGPYFTTSTQLRFQELELLATRKLLGGVLVEWRYDYWRVWLAGIGTPQSGADGGVSFKCALPFTGSFFEAGISARGLSGDSFAGGELGVGYEF